MHKLRELPRALAADTRGLTTVEYAIVLCLVAVVGVSMWSTFGKTINDNLTNANGLIGDQLSGATGGGD